MVENDRRTPLQRPARLFEQSAERQENRIILKGKEGLRMVTARRRLTSWFFPEQPADVPFRLERGSVLPVRRTADLLAPPVCPHCGRGKAACACGGTEGPLDGTKAPFYYEGCPQRYSAGCRPYAAEEYARMIARWWCWEYANPGSISIAAASGRSRDERRGFNPTQAIPEEQAKRLDLPVLPLPLAEGAGAAGTAEAAVRFHSGAGMLVVRLSGGTRATWSACARLTVDDVITTGATIAEIRQMRGSAAIAVVGTAAATFAGQTDQKYRIINKKRVLFGMGFQPEAACRPDVRERRRTACRNGFGD